MMNAMVGKYVKKANPSKNFWISRKAYAQFENGRVYDTQVAKFALSHMRIVDILDPMKVVQAAALAFTVLANGKANEFKGVKFRFSK